MANLSHIVGLTFWWYHGGMLIKLIGHQNILQMLQQMHERGRLGHALLFVGPKHVGKRTLAEELVFAIYALSPTHPDFLFLEREQNDKGKLKQNISIEQVRTLRSRLQLSSLGGFKVAVIDEAELLSLEAANALLKTLEEPTPKTQLILLASHVSGVPATIASRCQIVNVPLVSHKEMSAAFGEVLARKADGRPGLAQLYKTDDTLSQRRDEQAGAWQKLGRSSLSQKLGLMQKSLKQWEPLQLLDAWEAEAHRELIQQPTAMRAQLLQKMAITRKAIMGNVNNNLAFEQIIL